MCKKHFTSAQPQHQHQGKPKQQFQRRPQHSGKARQRQAAGHIFLVAGLKQRDLGFFLRVSPDHAGAGKVLLRSRGNIRKLRLDFFKPLMNPPSEILHNNAGDRQRRKRIQRELGADLPHKDQRHGRKYQRVRRVHNRRAQQHAHGIQVIGGAGHDVARAVLLVIGIGKRFQMAKHVIAQIVFNLT